MRRATESLGGPEAAEAACGLKVLTPQKGEELLFAVRRAIE
jgi:hypothetical protein